MFSDSLLEVTKTDSSVCGFVSSLEEALKVLKTYEVEECSRFVCTKRPGKFGKKGMFAAHYIFCLLNLHVIVVAFPRVQNSLHVVGQRSEFVNTDQCLFV